MQKLTYKVKKMMGIHARPASALAQFARMYQSDIKLYCQNRCANAKRMVEIMELSIIKMKKSYLKFVVRMNAAL